MANNMENLGVCTELLRGQCHIPFYTSIQCKNVLKKFLILNLSKRSMYVKIKKDQWMDVGHEGNELKPYASYPLTARTHTGLRGWCPWIARGKRSRFPDGPEGQQNEDHLFVPEL